MDISLREEVRAYLPAFIEKRKAQEEDYLHREIKGDKYRIPLDDRDIDIVVYRTEASDAPLVFCMYGGGFILGNHVIDDDYWDMMRNILGVHVISIGYRRSPEYPYPAPLNDAYDSINYIINHQEEFRFDSREYYVCGNSAGANLALGVCMLDKVQNKLDIKGMILTYPYVDMVTEPADKGHRKEDLGKYLMYAQSYVGTADPKDPMISQLYAPLEMLEGLPKALVIVADRDPLHAEGARLICRLRAAGVQVDSMVSKDMFHGFAEHCFQPDSSSMDPLMREQLRDGIIMERTVEMVEFIKDHICTN